MAKNNLLDTLKQDGTSTGINKEFIAKILKSLETKAVVYEIDDFTEIPQSVFSKLRAGDVVSYNADGEQMYCVAIYTDGDGWTIAKFNGNVLTLYHYIIYQEEWVYEDSQRIQLSALVSDDNKANKFVGFNNSGTLAVVDPPSGGTQLYSHSISYGAGHTILIISNAELLSNANKSNVISFRVMGGSNVNSYIPMTVKDVYGPNANDLKKDKRVYPL